MLPKKPADVVKAGIACPPGQLLLNSPSGVKTNAPFCSENGQMVQPPAPTPAVTSVPPVTTTPSSSDGSRIAASPFAKKRASEASIQLVMPWRDQTIATGLAKNRMASVDLDQDVATLLQMFTI